MQIDVYLMQAIALNSANKIKNKDKGEEIWVRKKICMLVSAL